MATQRWKQIAREFRTALYRGADPLDRLVTGAADEVLPPLHLRLYYYGTSSPSRYRQACDGARVELVSRGLLPHHRVLDIGCGVGNLAVGLVDYLEGEYVGFDIHAEAVAWCRSAITSTYPNFQFHHADLASAAYNTGGRTAPARFEFPLASDTFDVVFLGSVFTHLLPDAVEQYFREIARLLVPGGICVASFFLLNDDTRPAVEAGKSFMSFDVADASGFCRLHDSDTPESAVALEEGFVVRTCEQAGLRIRDIRRGGWWRGESHDQDVATITL